MKTLLVIAYLAWGLPTAYRAAKGHVGPPKNVAVQYIQLVLLMPFLGLLAVMSALQTILSKTISAITGK